MWLGDVPPRSCAWGSGPDQVPLWHVRIHGLPGTLPSRCGSVWQIKQSVFVSHPHRVDTLVGGRDALRSQVLK